MEIKRETLKDEQFLKSVRAEIAKANSSYERGWGEQWERFKEAVKMNAIERAVEIRFEERQEENNLKKMLQELLDAETATPGTFMEEIRTKCKLEAIDTKNTVARLFAHERKRSWPMKCQQSVLWELRKSMRGGMK